MELRCEFLICVWRSVAFLILLMSFVILEHCGVDVGLFIRKYLVIGLIVDFLFGDLIEVEY